MTRHPQKWKLNLVVYSRGNIVISKWTITYSAVCPNKSGLDFTIYKSICDTAAISIYWLNFVGFRGLFFYLWKEMDPTYLIHLVYTVYSNEFALVNLIWTLAFSNWTQTQIKHSPKTYLLHIRITVFPNPSVFQERFSTMNFWF